MDVKLERKKLNISSLKAYPDNPRQGSVSKIMESIEAHGQVRPLLVQKSTRYVLVGNHTMLALVNLGVKQAICDVIDVDDEQAKKIVVADNRTSDLADYDDVKLAQLLDGFDDLSGTAFDDDDLGRLLANVNADVPKFAPDDGEVPRLDKKTVHICPNCQHEF